MTVQTTQNRKVLFFTAGREATEQELELASQIPGQIRFRAPETTGIPANRETADAVAAVNTNTIPAYYKSGEGNLNLPNVTPTGDADAPSQRQILPNDGAGALSVAAAASNIQLYFTGLKNEDGSPDVIRLKSDPKLAWVSSDPTKATVSSSGVLDPVAAGTTTITATYTYDDTDEENPLTVTATLNVTVTA